MQRLSFKIAYPIIIAGMFILVAFIALNYETLNFNFYLVLCLLIIYIFLFGFATGQNFAVPVRKLLQRADDLSKGDLDSRFYSESKDEIGELAKVFNKIAADFQQTKEQSQTLEKSLDIKVKARTEALEETIQALEQKVKNRTTELEHLAVNVEKFQQDAKTRDAEAATLKSELAELREKLEKKIARKKKPTVVSEENAGIA
ncbi:MAG TPA: HAMP domain-containing protein [Negativicutes bacterium]|nr:HAMP domain-containing protein [Negativicutes bacterium]